MDRHFAIFDMDGTLIDSMPFWGGLLSEYLERLWVPEEERDRILYLTRRLSLPDAAAVIQQELRLNRSAHQVRMELGDLMDKHYMEDIPLKPGIAPYLRRLREDGVELCIATLTPSPLAKLCLERLNIAQYFAFLISCEDMGVGKDEPDIFLQCALELNAPPYAAAVYEDSYRAARVAKKAGFYTIGVYDNSGAHHWDDMCLLCDETIQDWSKAIDFLTI